jgi:GABA(A) receptor-associated protein
MINDFDKRYNETKKIREKYPERIPIMVNKASGCNLNDIDKKKYLVPCDMTIGQFIAIIRQRIKISPDKAIFIFINNVLPPVSATMINVYNEMKMVFYIFIIMVNLFLEKKLNIFFYNSFINFLIYDIPKPVSRAPSFLLSVPFCSQLSAFNSKL